jgi:sugar/nucleoside kinase (ribokinase family)
MTPDSPPLDLVVVGGLTIDRFPDGSSAPGGSVLHIASAAAARGRRVGIVTNAGDEPEARAGLEALHRLATIVESSPEPGTTGFRHGETAAGRQLWLGTRGGSLGSRADALGRFETRAVLYAPVAGEIPEEALATSDVGWVRGAILQGWLRTIDEGEEVRPLPLAALSGAMVQALRGFDLLVASREDLLAEGAAPRQQLRSMQRTFGARPVLVVTDGPEGAWIGVESSVEEESSHMPVPLRVNDVPTVGSGDVLAAFMLMGEWQRPPDLSFVRSKLDHAMRVVSEMLEGRRA